MALPRQEVTTGYVAELEAFSDLLRPLTSEQLATASRCDGWTVQDVAGHVVGTIVDIVGGNLDGQGTPEVTSRQVSERAGRAGVELADELDGARKLGVDLLAVFDDDAWALPAPGGYDGTLGDGVEALWYDTFLHADDIRSALGQPSVGGAGLRPSISHIAAILTQQGWGPATLALDGLPELAVRGGGGQRITGDPMRFILAATGRIEAAAIGLDPSVNIYA